MIRALQAFLLAVLLLAPSLAAADGSILKLRMFNRGAAAPPSSGLLPGASPPANEGQSAYAATAVPGNQGDPGAYGYGLPPIFSWNVPQFHTVSTPFNIGVVAFKAPSDAEYAAGVTSNIGYVDFECDNGTPVRATEMALNPDSSTVEFFVQLDPANFTPGLHECRATVVPTTGIGAVLQGNKSATSGALDSASLYINTNSDGSLTKYTRYVATTGSDDPACGATSAAPCLTITYAKERIRALTTDLGGSTICLAPGAYQYGATTESFARTAINQYLVIDSCGPGGAKANVTLYAGTGGNLKTSKVKLQNLTWTYPGVTNGGGIGGGTTAIGPLVWTHNVDFVGPGRFVRAADPFVLDSFPGGKYLTSVTMGNMLHGTGGNLLRNSSIDGLGSDAFSNTKLIINVEAANINRNSYATANSTAASNILTNVSNFAELPVGSYVGNMCGWGTTYTTYITAIDVGALTITMADPCITSGTGITINTGTHADGSQYDAASFSNVIQYGITMTNGFDGQAFFIGASTVRTNTGFALVDYTALNNFPGAEGFKINQIGTAFTNSLYLRTTWTGSFDWADARFLPATFSVIDSACNTTSFPGPVSGVTYRNSPTCD